MGVVDPRLLRRARAVRVLLAIDVALGLATALLVIVQAALIARIVAHVFFGASLRAVVEDLVLLAVVFAARGVSSWGFEAAGGWAASSVLSRLRLALVDRRLTADPAALDGSEAGEIAAAAVLGIEPLGAYFGRYVPQAVLACVVPVAVLAWVAAIDVDTALIMLVTLPLVPVFMWLIGRYTEERTRERWDSLRVLSTHFLDVVRGLPTLKAFNRSRAQAHVIGEVSERYRKLTMSTLRVGFLSGSVLELAATLGVALVAVTVGVRLDRGDIGFQAALTVLILAPELYLPLRQLGAQFHASADGLAVADRVLGLLDAPPAVVSTRRRIAPSPAHSAVRFEEVSFAYPSRAAPVLAGAELELLPGETVALVGQSGSGKTTMLNLLLRFAQPTDGRVTVGGADLAECDTARWRRFVAWVPQHPTLFRGTLAANIGLGNPSGDARDIRAAAELAGIGSFVRALPDGYETIVGDGGRAVSAGERRRIALARAFLKQAPLLLLDEPAADLDDANAALVADAIARIARGRTVLLTAHRPDLAATADRVVRLEDGRVHLQTEAAAA